MVTHVSDFGSNVNENLETWGRALGRSRNRRKIFDLIYGKQKKNWTSRQIIDVTGLDDVTALHEVKKLTASGLLHEGRENGRLILEKDARVQHNKRSIVRYADSSKARNALPTKRRPAGTTSATLHIRADRARATFLSIDDVDSFRKASKINSNRMLGDDLSKSQFRDGIKEILGELGHFADWPGEQHDLFSTKLRVKGKRRVAAFAFKGPAIKGVLTPAKCGKSSRCSTR